MDKFWRGLGETESNDNLDVNWIKEVEESMGAEVSEEEIAERVEVTADEVKRAIGKKLNWSGAGRDKIRNFGGKNSRSYTNTSQAYLKPSLMKNEILTYNG